MTSIVTVKKAIAEAGGRLYQSGMLAGTEGNISVRLDDRRLLITPGGFSKGRLAPDDMVLVDLDGNKLKGKHRPSSELPMHLFVYRTRSDIRACVHSHPPYTTAFSVAGIRLADDLLPEVVLFVGNIALTDFASPGTEAVPRSLEPYIETSNAFILRNHGLLTIGRDLDEALFRHETVEHYAHIVVLARQLGNVTPIPSGERRRLEALRREHEKSRSAGLKG
jgi:L-fuculose-phosphate aldolase